MKLNVSTVCITDIFIGNTEKKKKAWVKRKLTKSNPKPHFVLTTVAI